MSRRVAPQTRKRLLSTDEKNFSLEKIRRASIKRWDEKRFVFSFWRKEFLSFVMPWAKSSQSNDKDRLWPAADDGDDARDFSFGKRFAIDTRKEEQKSMKDLHEWKERRRRRRGRCCARHAALADRYGGGPFSAATVAGGSQPGASHLIPSRLDL